MSLRNAIMAAELVLLSSCTANIEPEPATQILLRVDCRAEVCEQGQRLEVRVDALTREQGGTGATRMLQVKLSEMQSWPVDIPIVPRDPRKLPDAIQVSADAFDSSNSAPLANARAITYFLRSSQRVLLLQLGRCGELDLGSLCEQDAACVGPQCRTCVDRSCESTPISDPKQLPELDAATLRPSSSVARPAESDASVVNEPTSPSMPLSDAATPADGTTGPKGGADAAANSGTTSNAPEAHDAGATRQDAAPASPVALEWTDPALLEDLPEDVVRPTFGRNRTGDLAVAWWQNHSTGFLWMQRLHNGAWEPAALRFSGSERPTSIWSAPMVGIDGAARAHLLALLDSTSSAGSRRMHWARWAGGDDSTNEAPWLLGRAPLNSVPTMLSVLDDGRAVAMFSGPPLGSDSTAQLFLTRYEPESWQAPVDVGSLAYAQADFPDNAANSVGDYVSAFKVRPANGDELVVELKLLVGHLTDTPLSTIVKLPEPLLGEVDVTMDEQGNAVALFALGNSVPDAHVFSLRYLKETKAWGSPERVSAAAAHSHDLALLPSGQPILVVREAVSGSSNAQVVLMHFLDGQGWSSRTLVGEPFVAASHDVVAVGANDHGRILVTWTQPSDPTPGTSGRGLFASHAEGAGAFSSPTRIAAGETTFHVVGAAWDNADHAFAIWTETASGSALRDLKWSCSR